MVKISRILSVSAIILGLYVIVAASQFPEGADGVPGPGFFPVILGIMIILLSVLQLFNTRKDKDDDTKFMNEGTRRVLISCAIIIGYLVGMEVLGFIVSTPIFLFSIMWYFSVRKVSTLISIPLVSTGILYFVFLKFLSVSLPTGLFF
ncbi:MAG: tripartite tricarboxylate transporter TctB family protein [Sphaerochaetaceae bacterium]|nr:tripartite tricarboxylate transporter TctB family protein [Sphaerochaetaceae bacterium]